MAQQILVFDVGKTNKKLLLFDENLQLQDSLTAKFDERIEGQVHFEQIAETAEWFTGNLARLAARYPLDVVSITTHGATIACIDDAGELAVPLVAYTTEPGEKFQKEFYAKFGDPVSLQRQTATPEFGNLLSPAKTIYYLQEHYPEEFSRVRHILNLPQYFACLLTGKVCADPTYIGCHSYLWDFHTQKWSGVAAALQVTDRLPSRILPSWEVLGTCRKELLPGAGKLPLVTAGVHDSNASLLPYLVKSRQDFVLNSTGTWCVAMRPAQQVSFREDELGKSVFYNLSVFNQPVKTAIFMGGLEFDTYLGLIQRIHGGKPIPAYNHQLAEKILAEQQLFILPSVVAGTGQFPASVPRVIEGTRSCTLQDLETGRWVPEFFHDFETALAVLKISLAIQTRVALDRVGAADCSQIFIEGGFRRDNFYNTLLTALYPGAEILLTGMQEATAFGAALLGKAALEKTTPLELGDCFSLEMSRVPGVELPGFKAYEQVFLARI